LIKGHIVHGETPVSNQCNIARFFYASIFR
jgi:hypothetical protein